MNRNIILTCAITGAGDTADWLREHARLVQAAGRPGAELDRRRDDFLVELLDLVQKYWPEAEGLEGRI